MSQKPNLIDQYRTLHEIKSWLADKLSEESDRTVRDALFGLRDAIGLALLFLKKWSAEQMEYTTRRVNES